MSLLDSLLLDPSPFDLWVAISASHNGNFNILAAPAPTSTSFSYQMTGVPTANADASPPPSFGAVWQVNKFVVEGNIVELIPNQLPGGYGPPTGVLLFTGDFTPVYVLRQVLIRDNVIRLADGAVDSTGLVQGIWIASCENALVEGNVIDLSPSNRIDFKNFSGIVECFNNQAPDGALILGRNIDANSNSSELATTLGDVATLAL
jgi:hypothetical protein